jgi:hypothetical protein
MPTPYRPPIERFYEKVYASEERSFDGTPCLEFRSRLTHDGYGRFSLGRGNDVYAHRWFYEHIMGPIPEGLQLDHLCRTPNCVNVDHLEPVTNATNVFRGNTPTTVNAGKLVCKRGHPFDATNTYEWFTASGSRRRACKECHNIRQRAKRRKGVTRNVDLRSESG